MTEPGAIHLMQWIEANAQAFLPPVANKEVFPESEFIFQIIRGPNARNDFHIDPGDEIFYQLAGDITVQIMDDGTRRDVAVREGEVFLCRAGTPHCPVRPPATWGLVIERKRKADENESFLWFCEKCDEKVLSHTIPQGDFTQQVLMMYEAFNADEKRRTCQSCGYVFPAAAVAERLSFLQPQ